MNEFNFKLRFKLVIGSIFLIFFMYLLVSLGIEKIAEYLIFPESFIYTSGAIFIALGSFAMLPLLIMLLSPIFYGVKADVKLQKIYFKVMVYALIIASISSLTFSLIYLPILERRGYIACKGTPMGYTPGMGTQYVLDLSLCGANK
ncbi:hypothetical protein HWV01_11870 [Moritella sp. 5]|uniref:hypothetical protein n=1 Tax=Moritella sp. 5 TaxID=2746231 RepID=UPI001BAC7B9A|nr:hypothetical protein [Moritella sp. 5]QUM78831.1 hypothetical protein HWV01_11870 [Moritella sp. 5]